MKKKNLMAVLMCTACLTAASVAPGVVFAEETEAVTEASENTSEAETENGTESAETEAKLERPDYTASDYVTLGEYKGLVVTLDPITVTDEEVDEEIRYHVQLAEALETYSEGQVQEGDTANIDFEGKLDGEAFDGGTSAGYDLIIGSDSFIDGFEDGLIGVSVGETVDLPLTFPENYGNTDLAGKEVVFTVTVNSIKRMPELTDELVNTISDGEYTDVESYRKSISENLLKTKEDEKDSVINNEILTLVANNSKINDYPEEMVAYGVANMKSFYEQYAEAYGMEYGEFLESFLGLTAEEFDSEAQTAVKQNMQQELYMRAIAEAENIELSEEEYKAGCDELAERYGYESGDDLVAAYDEDTVRLSVLQEKVLDFLRENATIEEASETETGTEAETEAE
ncbi:MAG: trigger factor [Lachnospiraceae bacterium]|nr:trigger factor [Lachnospiraceae bacterium]